MLIIILLVVFLLLTWYIEIEAIKKKWSDDPNDLGCD
jgi:hypothetical protein